MKAIEELINAMLLETDKLALLEFQLGTPEHELQASLVRNAARYRIARDKEKE